MISFLNLFPLLAIFWLLFVAIIIISLHLLKIRFPYYWLLATFAVLVAWLMVLFSRNGLPYIQNPAATLPAFEKTGLPSLIVDGVSWPLALALITLSVVVYLTLVIHATELDWFTLGGGVALTAFSLMAIQSRDSSTIRTAWAAIDILEFLFMFYRLEDRSRLDNLIKAYGLRIVSIMLFLWGTIDTTVLMIAAAIRIVVIPAAFLSEKELNVSRGMIYLLSLISPVSALIVFPRVALTVDASHLGWLFIGFLAFGAISAIGWFNAPDSFTGRRYWIFTLCSFVILSSIRGLLIASVIWGVAMIISGGLLFFGANTFRKPIFLYVGMFAITSIPYMPTWDGASLYTSTISFSIIFFVLIQALLVSGYFKHIHTFESGSASSDRLVVLINPMRILLMVLVYWLIAYLFWRDGALLNNTIPWIRSKNIVDYFIGLIVVIISILIILVQRNRHRFPAWLFRGKLPFIPGKWLFTGGEVVFQWFGNVMGGLSSLIEGESGILLTLLLLALLITFFIQG